MATGELLVIRAAEVQAAVARALITALGMAAENMLRESQGHTIAYDAKAFVDLIEQENIGFNAVATMVRD